MTDIPKRPSLAEKQALLRQAIEVRRKLQAASQEPQQKASLPEHVPASFYKIGEFPRYRQMQLHRELADRAGLQNPFFLLHDGIGKDTTVIGGREVINFSTYNYLGINGDPRVNRAAQLAAEKFGTSASSSRIVGGERPPHRELELALAKLHAAEDSLTFVSGYLTNVTVISTILSAGDAVVMDRLVHNSIIQGVKMSGASVHTFPHNDLGALDALLKSMRHRYERVLVVVEGLYSMDGDLCPLDKLISLRERHKILLMVDEAHSVGAIGATGRGVGEHFGVAASDVDIWMGTLSKTFAGCGGYVAGSRELIELLKFTAPGFVFSVGMPPPIAAACSQAIQIMLAEPQRVRQLQANGQFFARVAQEHGLDTGRTEGYNIVPVVVGQSVLAGRLATGLLHRGIQVQPIVYPAVEEGAARLRFFLSSDHSEQQLRTAVEQTSLELAALGDKQAI